MIFFPLFSVTFRVCLHYLGAVVRDADESCGDRIVRLPPKSMPREIERGRPGRKSLNWRNTSTTRLPFTQQSIDGGEMNSER